MNEEIMKNKISNFQTDAQLLCKQIEDFVRDSLKNLKRNGAVIGLSGGLDSAVTAALTVRSLGKENVHLLYMPEKDSNPIHWEHAKRLADHLGIRLNIYNISSIIKAARTYKILPLGLIPGRKLRTVVVEFGMEKLLKHNDERILIDRLEPEEDSWLAKGNSYGMTKHRIRMVVIYQFAELRNLMVIGAANRTELLTGTFSQWGIDHCADIMPVLHIYRSQLEEIAEYINVPDYIRNKPSDPDLFPAKLNKGTMLGRFQIADHILYNMENNIDKNELYKVYDKKIVDHLFSLHESSMHMRKSPYHL